MGTMKKDNQKKEQQEYAHHISERFEEYKTYLERIKKRGGLGRFACTYDQQWIKLENLSDRGNRCSVRKTVLYPNGRRFNFPGPLVCYDTYEIGEGNNGKPIKELIESEIFGACKYNGGRITFLCTKYRTYAARNNKGLDNPIYSGITFEFNTKTGELTCQEDDGWHLPKKAHAMIDKFNKELKKAKEAEKQEQPGK